MKEKMCCIVGDPQVEIGQESEIKQKLKAAIIKQIEQGAIYFECGVERGFDHLAAQAVLDVTKKNMDIRLFVVRPSPHNIQSWIESDKALLERILNSAGGQLYVRANDEPVSNEAIRKEMMNNSDYCIAYQCKENAEIGECASMMQRIGAKTICIS